VLVAATLRDVAEMAGVSISTASRAIAPDRTRPVAADTELRIREAARTLNYSSRTAASARRATARQAHTGKVGVILRGASYKFADPFWAPVLDGLDQQLAKHDYNLAFTLTLSEVRHSNRRNLLSNERVDGMVLLGPVVPMPEVIDLEHTIVVEGLDEMRWNGDLAVDIVTVEKRRAIYQVVAHLAALGRRRLGFLGPRRESDERAEAFPHALARAGLPYTPALMQQSPWSADGARRAALALLAQTTRPDAIVCASDVIAMGTMQAAREQGLRLPQDLAITGFDDVPFASSLDPPLTTVSAPRKTLGAVAGDRIIARINQPDLPAIILTVRTTLMVRASCGAQLERA